MYNLYYLYALKYNQQTPSLMESRVKEIDYLKCIFIILMIIFHLVYIGDKYPYTKQIVYTFHMSAFLIISGYLANNRKDARSFLRKFLWIFIPYACMEAAYTVMSHFLPVRESVDAITPAILLDKIFLHPIGPYWYLHTLILCSLIYYITFRYVRLSGVSPGWLWPVSACLPFPIGED